MPYSKAADEFISFSNSPMSGSRKIIQAVSGADFAGSATAKAASIYVPASTSEATITYVLATDDNLTVTKKYGPGFQIDLVMFTRATIVGAGVEVHGYF